MKASILIVEDEGIVAASLATKLDKLGYMVTGSTASGEEAIRLARESRPDLVLMDIQLSGAMDGVEAAQIIRTECELPVIYLTAHSDRDTLQRAKHTEPFGYILKPFEEIELESHIQMALYKHESERRLRESEDRYRVLSEASFEGIAIAENGYIIDVNDQLSEMSGYERLELLGQPVTRFVVPENEKMAKEAILSGKKSQNLYRGFRKDGTLAIFEVSSRPFVWQGKNVRVMAIRDITTLKNAEEALIKSKEQIQQQFNEIQNYYDTAPVGLCVLDTDLRFIRVNARFAEVAGKPAAEYAGRTIRDMVPHLAEHGEKFALQLIQTGEPIRNIELTTETPSMPGIKRTWRENWYPIKDADGKVFRINAISQEITDLKQASEALRESKEQVQQQLNEIQNYYDAAPIGLSVLSTDFRILRVNALMAELVGKPAAEIIGRTVREVAPQLSEMAETIVNRVITTGEPVRDLEFSRELPGQPGSTRYWIESLYPLRDSHGNFIGINILVKEITDLKRAEKALKESEERLQLAVRASKEAIWDLNLENGSFSSNEEFHEILGQLPEAVSPVQWWINKIHPDDHDRVTIIFEKAILGKATSCWAEYRLHRPDGSWAHVYDRAIIARNETGEPYRVVGAMMDITERKVAESELYFSRERLKMAQQAGSIGTFDWDLLTSEIEWTEELQRIYGYSTNEFNGTYAEWERNVFPEDLPQLKKIMDAGIRNCTGFETEFRITRQDGEIRWIGAWAKVICEPSGKAVRMVGANIDITERKQNEDFMVTYLERLNKLINVSFEIIRHTSPKELLQCVVEDARILTGARIAIIGHGYENSTFKISSLAKAPDMPDCPGEKQFSIEKGGVYIDILKNLEPVCFTDKEMRSHPEWWGLPEGHAPLHGLCGAPLTGSDGTVKGLIMVSNKVHDEEFSEIDYAMLNQISALTSLAVERLEVSAEIEKRAGDLSKVNSKLEEEIQRRTLAEQILIQYTDDLSRSNEELDSFASAVSHDLQEPLRSIAGLIKLLERKYSSVLDSQGKEYITRSLDSSKRLEAMIHNLLAYSRITTRGREFEYCSLEDVLASATENLQASISRTNAVISNTPLPQVYCDADQLVRVFQNLIGNSMKYSAAQQPEIHIASSRQGDEYIISVSDNGEGIEPEYLEHIFDIFSRSPSKLNVTGTGMGLAVCRKIITRHKGKIWAESKPGLGSTFFFTFPAMEAEE